jgi:hypothetical protein
MTHKSKKKHVHVLVIKLHVHQPKKTVETGKSNPPKKATVVKKPVLNHLVKTAGQLVPKKTTKAPVAKAVAKPVVKPLVKANSTSDLFKAPHATKSAKASAQVLIKKTPTIAKCQKPATTPVVKKEASSCCVKKVASVNPVKKVARKSASLTGWFIPRKLGGK